MPKSPLNKIQIFALKSICLLLIYISWSVYLSNLESQQKLETDRQDCTIIEEFGQKLQQNKHQVELRQLTQSFLGMENTIDSRSLVTTTPDWLVEFEQPSSFNQDFTFKLNIFSKMSDQELEDTLFNRTFEDKIITTPWHGILNASSSGHEVNVLGRNQVCTFKLKLRTDPEANPYSSQVAAEYNYLTIKK